MKKKIDVPKLILSGRKREYSLYTEDERRNVVIEYLFEGKSHRQLDQDVLGLDSSESRGYQAMGILHYIGLKNDFKGLFQECTVDEAIEIIEDANDEAYKLLLTILKGNDNQKSLFEYDIELETDNEFTSVEGGKRCIYTTRYERNPKLRREAINIHGTTCAVCGFDFYKRYGEIGKDYIEIHHIKPLFEISESIEVNPQTDLIPVCSNCHRMIHRKRNEVMSIEKLKACLKK